MFVPDRNSGVHSQAQETLTRNEPIFRALIEQGVDIIALLTAQGLVSYASPSIMHILGYPPEEMVGRNALDLVHPDDLARMSAVFQQILQTPEKSVRAESRLRHQNGAWRWFEGVGTNLLAVPEVGAIVGNFRDITERKQAEERMLFQADILHTVTDSIIVTDLQGKVIYWNERAQQVFGYSSKEMLGGTLARLYMDAGPEYLASDLENILAGKDYIGEWLGRRKDGTPVWIDIKTTVLRNKEGTTTGFIGIAKDITANKARENALRVSEERLRLALKAGNIGVWDWDVQQNVLTWSENVYVLHGVTEETFSVTSENFMTLVHPEDHARIQEAIDQSLREQAPYNINLRIVTPQGETRWLTTTASVTYDSAGNPIRMLGATSDITEQKELEQRKDEFIGMASHELKTPITTLKGRAQLLKRRLERQGITEAVENISRMEEQIDRLNRLVTDLLDVSKIQAGRLDYANEQIDIDPFLHDIVQTAQEATSTHTLVVHGASHKNIAGDRDRLEQVFFNLINNAVKYSPRAEKVDISIATTQDMVTVSIRDDGVGIPLAHQSKIFDRFYRVQDVNDRTFPGLGMGLYISYEIVQRHGGTITVTSEEGQGSTFTVSLPLESKRQ
jgi:PAS domain S-box-containing protein